MRYEFQGLYKHEIGVDLASNSDVFYNPFVTPPSL
jgi:hypothetical protein